MRDIVLTCLSAHPRRFVTLYVNLKLSMFPAIGKILFEGAGLKYDDETSNFSLNLSFLSEVMTESIPQVCLPFNLAEQSLLFLPNTHGSAS